MNILIIDDQTLLRTGMRLFLKTISSTYQLFEASEMPAALGILKGTCDIDLIISEIKIGGMGSAEVVRWVRLARPDVPILFYSGLAERLFALPALRAGANGFIMKKANSHELTKAISTVASGGKYMSVELQASLLPMIDRGHHTRELESVERLSERERTIMTQVVEGKSTKEIARLLNLKCNTVSTYKKRIYIKMNVTDTFELSQKAACF